MTPRLLDAFIPALAVVRQFVLAPQGDAPTLAQRLDELLRDAHRTALEQGHSSDNVRLAHFAVVAWMDEALLTSAWSDAGQWSRHLLQRKHFGIHNAGVAFYEQLKAVDPVNSAVEEVFLLCLAMGFQGQYGHGGSPAEREMIRQALLDRVLARAPQEVSAAAGALLFPEGYATAPVAPRARWTWLPTRRAVLIALGALCVLLALYVLSNAMLARGASELMSLIR